jgi:hypothetical protein
MRGSAVSGVDTRGGNELGAPRLVSSRPTVSGVNFRAELRPVPLGSACLSESPRSIFGVVGADDSPQEELHAREL